MQKKKKVQYVPKNITQICSNKKKKPIEKCTTKYKNSTVNAIALDLREGKKGI